MKNRDASHINRVLGQSLVTLPSLRSKLIGSMGGPENEKKRQLVKVIKAIEKLEGVIQAYCRLEKGRLEKGGSGYGVAARQRLKGKRKAIPKFQRGFVEAPAVRSTLGLVARLVWLITKLKTCTPDGDQ